MRNKPKFTFKSQAFDAGYQAGLKAAKEDMALRNRVLTAKERLKQMPQWVKMLVKENNLRVDHTLEIEITEEPSLHFMGNAGDLRSFIDENRGAVTFAVKGVRKKK